MARTSRTAPRTLPRQPLPRFPSGGRKWLLGTTALLPLALLAAPAQAQAPGAMPTGGQVTAGQALIQQQGTRTQITQGSDRAVIDWQRFDVGRDATVNFTQPSQNSWTLNRVNTPDPSLIAGRITANGGVAIVNPSGVVFAEGAQVNVGSLVATAAGITNQNFMAGRLVFDGAPNPGARVENRGEITVADRGLVALVAPGTANHGAIRARLGTAIVAGAETYRLDLAGDGLLSIDVTQAVRRAPDGTTALVTNSGVIAAEGGQVVLTAQAASGLVEQVVRNTGQVTGARVAIQGRGGDVAIAGGSVTAPGGRVDITAPGAGVTVAAGARVSASAATGGGRVQLGGSGTARTRVEGRVAARGTTPAARGGRVAVQATEMVTVAAGAVVEASGGAGGGEVLLGTTGLGRAQEMARGTWLQAGATVRADATARGTGGVVVVNSAERTVMAAHLSARGGPGGGDGGFVEVSGMRALTLNMLRVDVAAGPGGALGTLLIDPVNIIVRDTLAVAPEETDGALSGGGFLTDGAAGDPTTVIISPADIAGFGGNVTLEAQDSLTVASAITMPANSLTLTASSAGGSGIFITAPITVSAGTLTLNSNSFLNVGAGISASLGVGMNVTFGISGAGTVTTPATLRVRGFDGTDVSGVQGLNLTGANDVGALDLIGTSANVTFAQPNALLVTNGQVGQFGSLTLGSDGVISGSNIVAGDLVIRGAGLAETRAGGLSLLAGHAVGTLDARTNGTALTFSQLGTLVVAQANARTGAGAGSGTDGGVVTLGVIGAGNTLTLSGGAQGGSLVLNTTAGMTLSGALVATQGGIALAGSAAGSTLTQGAGGSVTAPNGQTITLGFDQFTLGATLSAGAGGTVLLARQTAGAMGVGAGAAPDTVLNAATLALRVPDGTLRLETSGTLTLGSAFTRTGALGLRSTGGAIALNGDVAIGAHTLSLDAAGGITGTGAVAAATLRVRGGDGSATSGAAGLDLQAAGNAITTLDARTANVALRFTQAGALAVTQAHAGSGNVTLGSDGAITGGDVVGTSLTVRDRTLASFGGGLNLTGAGNAIGTLDAQVTGADLVFGQGPGFTVARAIAGFADVRLGSGGVITGSGAGGNNLIVRGAGLNDASRAGGLSLQGNFSGTIDVRTNGTALTYAQNNGFTVTQADAITGDVTLGSAFTISGGGVVGGTLTIRGAALGVERAGGLDLTTGNAISALDARTSGTLRFAQANGFALTQVDAGTSAVTLGSDASFPSGTGNVTAGLLTIRDATLALADGRAGGFDLVNTGGIATLDARTANATLTYSQAAGFEVLQANARTGVGAGVGTAGGAVTLAVTGAGNTLTVPLAGGVQGGSVTLEATGTLALAGPVLATQSGVTLSTTAAGGHIDQAAGGTVTAADGMLVMLTADRLTLGANMTAGASGGVRFTRFSPGNIVIGGGALPDTLLDPTGIATFLGTGHLRLIASDRVTVQSSLTRTTGDLTLHATTPGGGIAVDAAVDAGTRFVNLETPGAITGTGVITTGSLVARGDGDFLSRAGSVALTGANRAERLNARTDGGDVEFRNAANLRVTRIDARGTGQGNVTLTLAGAGLLLEVANDISAGQLTLVADDMAIATGAPALIIPGGAVRLMPFTAGRGVTLGGEVAGTLSLTTAELQAIGGLGGDGLTDPASVLRIGRLDTTPVGSIAIPGAVDLEGRVQALELYAAGSITGSGGIIVAAFGAAAGGDLVLDNFGLGGSLGAGRLAALTDAGTLGGVAPGTVAVWGGTRNTDPASRQADRLHLGVSGSANLLVAGSVLASGSGGLSLSSPNGSITVAPGRWITAEAGTVDVLGGLGVLNQGSIFAQDRSGGSVRSSLMAGVVNEGSIVLGCGCGPADASSVDGWAGVSNHGLMIVGRVISNRGMLTNAAGAELRAHSAYVGYTLSNAGLLAADSITAGGLVNTGSLVAGVLASGFVNEGLLAATEIMGGTGQNSGLLVTRRVTSSSLGNGAAGRIESGTGQALLTLAMPDARAAALGGTAAAQGGALALTTTRGGDLALQTTQGGLGNAGVITAAGSARLASAQDITLTAGALAAGGNMELAAGRDLLQSGGGITAGAALRLDAGRDARQTGGSATAASLGQAGAGLLVGRDLRWDVTAPEVFGITTGRDLILGLAGGAVTLAGPLQAGGALSVRAGALALHGGVTLGAGGTLALTAAADLTLAGASLGSGGAMTLGAGGALVMTGGGAAAGGELTAQAGGALAATGASLTAGRDLTLASSGGGVTLAQVTARADGGALSLAAAGDAILRDSDLRAAQGANVTAGAGLSIARGNLAGSGGDVVLSATGALGATGASLTAGRDLTLASSGGGVTLVQVTGRANGGALAIAAAGAATLRDSDLRAAQGLLITAGGGLVMNPTTLEAGRDLVLGAGGGLDITGGALRAGGALQLVAGGAMRLDGVSLAASTAAADTPAGFRPLRLEAGGDLAFTGNTLSADRAELVAGGVLTTAGSGFGIGTGLLLAAPGGIGQPGEALTTVGALAAERLPLVILDTRRNLALVRLPAALTPATTDRPGLGNAQQPWQVPGRAGAGALVFGVNDGVRARPGSGEAGAVALNMAIGGSPLFLLLDGATASGTIEAGRLGVFGRPGAATTAAGRQLDLRGELDGIAGIAAARFGTVSGAEPGLEPAPGELSQYRFNDCVLSTVNCVAPVSFTLPAVPQVNTLVLTNERQRLDESDVLLPNIADEDY